MHSYIMFIYTNIKDFIKERCYTYAKSCNSILYSKLKQHHLYRVNFQENVLFI